VRDTLLTLRARLAGEGRAVGTWVTTPSPEIVEMLALAGFHFCVLDLEHGYFGTEALPNLLRAAELHGMAALVRIPQEAPDLVGKTMDLGATGLMVPSIASAEVGARMLALTRYPPRGVRGAHLSTRHLRYSALPFAEVARTGAPQPFTVLQIESALPEHEIDAIAALPGLDVVFLGINDLAASMGHVGQPEHPAVVAMVERIGERCRTHGVHLGTWTRKPEQVAGWVQRGFAFMTVSNNELLFYEAAADLARRAIDPP
jgi:2-keto-3-deoxy-L-rhamnonate aldolase RhmA